jgi:hypothetical protein
MKPVQALLCSWVALFLALPAIAQEVAQEEEIIDSHRVVAHEALVRFRESAGRELRSALIRKHSIGQSRVLSRRE